MTDPNRPRPPLAPPGGPIEGSADEKAGGMLDRLAARAVPGERLLARLGPRAFDRPRVAISARIFKKYRVSDPWDPNPSEPEDPIELGPVSVRLGERRTVAPHLAPPEPPKKKVVAPVDPVARFRPKPTPTGESSPKPTPAPAPKPTASPSPPAAAPRPTEAARPPAGSSELGREFGARDQRQPLRKPIPMRPDRAPAGEAPVASAAPAAAPISRSPPRGVPSVVDSGANAGRFRMKPTASSGPVVLPPPVEVPASVAPAPVPEVVAVADIDLPAPAPAPAAAPAPVNRSLPGKSGGLDDLFGMAAAGGRMGLSKRKDSPKDEAG